MLDIKPVAALIVFALVWVLALVLGRFFFKPVSKVMREREARLAEDAETTRKALRAAEEDLKRVEDEIRRARAEAAALREKAEAEALRERNRILQEIGAESRARLEAAKAELRKEAARIKAELDAKTGELAGEIEKKLLD